MKSVIIIGAGPAGISAAIRASDLGLKVILLESMPRIARKLGITGKGRGNLTNTCDYNEFLKHFNNEGRFLKSSFKTFFNKDLVDFFEREGLNTIEERGKRVFVKSGKAIDAVNCLYKSIQKRGIKLLLNTKAESLIFSDDKCLGVNTKAGTFYSDAVLIATGGKTYPVTGSTGDGYNFAKAAGHSITPLYPSLCALITNEDLNSLNGIQLKNTKAELRINNKKCAEEFGEIDILDGCLSGPIILTLSRKAVPAIENKEECEICVDFKPALDHQKLDLRLLRDIEKKKDGTVYDLVAGLLPGSFRKFFLKRLNLSQSLKVLDIKKEVRLKLRNSLKEFKFIITGHDSWDKAIITSGGVCQKEINSSTLCSKIIKNLFFAGEVIDVDADTGGFNLQAAFSTGYLAGTSIAHLLLAQEN